MRIDQNNPKNRRTLSFERGLICIIVVLLFFSKTYADNWQRVYLASYPRSGNHWMRFLIEEATRIATSSVYRDPDKPHLPKPFPWKGYCPDRGYAHNCRYPKEGEIVVVKTHYPHLVAEPGDKLPYVRILHLVRHPVDALYSLYLHSQNGKPSSPTMPHQTLMGFSHSLRQFDAYWADQENVLTVRYEDLLADPFTVLKQCLAFIGYSVTDADIARAIAKYPPKDSVLKHLSMYPPADVEYIERELQDFMQKYSYSLQENSFKK